MTEEIISPSTCQGSGQNGHKKNEYGRIGFSPCEEYVAHESKIVCDVISSTTITPESVGPKNCECRTDTCPCGDFVSHKVYEPCTGNPNKN